MIVHDKIVFHRGWKNEAVADYYTRMDGRCVHLQEYLSNSYILPVICAAQFRTLRFRVAENLDLQIFKDKRDNIIIRHVSSDHPNY